MAYTRELQVAIASLLTWIPSSTVGLDQILEAVIRNSTQLDFFQSISETGSSRSSSDFEAFLSPFQERWPHFCMYKVGIQCQNIYHWPHWTHYDDVHSCREEFLRYFRTSIRCQFLQRTCPRLLTSISIFERIMGCPLSLETKVGPKTNFWLVSDQKSQICNNKMKSIFHTNFLEKINLKNN
jgi:hypothetical protein